MKIQKLAKRFQLNKQTVSNLDDSEMNSVKGGYTVCLTTCITCEETTIEM